MLKKIVLLGLVFMVVGVMFATAQSGADIQAMEQLTKDFQAGKITLAEFQRRLEELTTRAGQQQYQQDQQQHQQQRQQQQIQGQQGEQYKKIFPGATAGWPAASAFRRYGKTVTQPNIQTPNGITFSYKTVGEKLFIYAFKNFISDPYSIAAAQFNSDEKLALYNHFERVFGTEVSDYYSGDEGGFFIDDPSKPPYTRPTAANRTVTHYIIRVDYAFQKTGTINVGGYALVEEYYIVFEISPDQVEDRYREFG